MKNIITFIILTLPLVTIAQKGTVFPDMEAENLVNDYVNIPEDITGKHTLIGVAFSKKSEADLKSWYNPVYDQLIKEPEDGGLFSFSYDVNVYFIPMLTGAKKAAYGKVMKKVEKDVDPKLHPHILFYKGSFKTYEEALKISDKNDPYFYLLDEEGEIIYATKGAYNRNKLQKIIDELPFE